LSGRDVLPFRTTGRAEQNGIGIHRVDDRLVGQRDAEPVERNAAEQPFGDCE
jgi:hypothetical protein